MNDELNLSRTEVLMMVRAMIAKLGSQHALAARAGIADSTLSAVINKGAHIPDELLECLRLQRTDVIRARQDKKNDAG